MKTDVIEPVRLHEIKQVQIVDLSAGEPKYQNRVNVEVPRTTGKLVASYPLEKGAVPFDFQLFFNQFQTRSKRFPDDSPG
ncbi:hypothetical protein [Larkinella rosea]|uniref:Uncharacterized protein n=1 Tax=Larkinella rosea TaxID=2025312 RepID=A0A3P1BZD4_9BACT|nr:hypothetical protein [Larkinella rosea]RRB06437.1 hypothetical protein EHT25_01125 [Larkinella rosea]